jgi:hypothetical protein
MDSSPLTKHGEQHMALKASAPHAFLNFLNSSEIGYEQNQVFALSLKE